ncbi:MAG: DUF554 family protein [Verrucomicrobia bacterium]|nr:DUF554 family protein [Verrucomicrobiota bacterium]
MTGTILNAAGILAGSLLGLGMRQPPSAPTQQAWKFALGALTVWVGLGLTWKSVGGGVGAVARQLAIVVLAMVLGRMAGRAMRLQVLSNRVGQFARSRMKAKAGAGAARGWRSDGFLVGAALFCVTPLGLVGAVQDGLVSYWPTLAVKGVMDALAAMAFVGMFGGSVMLSVVPVVALQGTVSLLSQAAGASLPPLLVDAINATGGLLVFAVALVIWELKKVDLVSYLPSLAVAPVLAWLWT